MATLNPFDLLNLEEEGATFPSKKQNVQQKGSQAPKQQPQKKVQEEEEIKFDFVDTSERGGFVTRGKSKKAPGNNAPSTRSQKQVGRRNNKRRGGNNRTDAPVEAGAAEPGRRRFNKKRRGGRGGRGGRTRGGKREFDRHPSAGYKPDLVTKPESYLENVVQQELEIEEAKEEGEIEQPIAKESEEPEYYKEEGEEKAQGYTSYLKTVEENKQKLQELLAEYNMPVKTQETAEQNEYEDKFFRGGSVQNVEKKKDKKDKKKNTKVLANELVNVKAASKADRRKFGSDRRGGSRRGGGRPFRGKRSADSRKNRGGNRGPRKGKLDESMFPALSEESDKPVTVVSSVWRKEQ